MVIFVQSPPPGPIERAQTAPHQSSDPASLPEVWCAAALQSGIDVIATAGALLPGLGILMRRSHHMTSTRSSLDRREPAFIRLQIPTFLGALLLCSQSLFVTGVAFAVDTDARIRATVADGDRIISAIAAFQRDHGELPSRIDRLVPRYLADVPMPLYGVSAWEYRLGPAEHPMDDERVSVRLDPMAPGFAAAQLRPANAFTLSVRLDATNPVIRFWFDRGCWRLPVEQLNPTCW